MIELYVIAVLAGLNLIQALFWGYQVHTLVNKLMCKNLAEYNLIKKGPHKTKTVNLTDDDMDEDLASELNGMFGFKGVS